MRKILVLVLFALSSHSFAFADDNTDELDPFDKNVEQVLENFDQHYWEETGTSPFVDNFFVPMGPSCSRLSCKVWIQIVKSSQTAYLYIDGQLSDVWKVSTGAVGHATPNFDKHPNGRIYDTYSSNKFPGGDFKGLGNMPYAVFIDGGFAVHGTPAGNWRKLGSRASHGCIRVHPDNAKTFNRLVREHGIAQTWVTVQD